MTSRSIKTSLARIVDLNHHFRGFSSIHTTALCRYLSFLIAASTTLRSFYLLIASTEKRGTFCAHQWHNLRRRDATAMFQGQRDKSVKARGYHVIFCISLDAFKWKVQHSKRNPFVFPLRFLSIAPAIRWQNFDSSCSSRREYKFIDIARLHSSREYGFLYLYTYFIFFMIVFLLVSFCLLKTHY